MKIWKTWIASALITLPLTVAVGTASANGKDAKEVSYSFDIASSNFTNCGDPPRETTCLGTGVRATRFASQVGNNEHEEIFVDVSVFEIHQHANGTFEIGRLVDHGSGSGDVDVDGLGSAHVDTTFRMDAGATAKVRFALAGTGTASPYSGNTDVSESGCPSGVANINYRGSDRDAVATGQISIGGVVQVPTTAAGPASINIERDKGSCTTA
jgi:hypothetical protein